jgi:hypothetical protein
VPEPDTPASLADDARARVMPLFDDVELTVRTASAIPAEPSGKFRVSRRGFPLDIARCFEGCEGQKPL